MSEALIAAGAALLASLLTGSFSFGAVLLQQWRRSRAEQGAALEGAFRAVLARSWGTILRAGTMTVAMQQRSGTADITSAS